MYCDLTTDSWGWIVFQRRQHASVSFHRTWNYYRSGFGDFGKNFWLGNYKIHRITAANKMLLRIELEDWNGKKVFAHYNTFKVDNEKNNGHRSSLTMVHPGIRWVTIRTWCSAPETRITTCGRREAAQMTWPGDGGLTIVTTPIWTGSSWGTYIKLKLLWKLSLE